jgi:mannose-6-phosphate isomerase class I
MNKMQTDIFYQNSNTTMSIEEPMRKTEQEIMPAYTRAINKPLGYDIYPYRSLGHDKIFSDYSTLVDYIIEQKTVVIDGYIGVFWKRIINALSQEFALRGLRINIIDASLLLKSEVFINEMVEPFLGEKDSVWGKKTTLKLIDFFELDAFKRIPIDLQSDVNIVIGCGASFVEWDAELIYVDLPKNELQHRMAAGAICNLGMSKPQEPTEMYKRFYFVDWVVLNQHKEDLVRQVDIFVDAQWEEQINWAFGKDIREGLQGISSSVFRARPWFAPGAWGGQWMKEHMPQLNQTEVNYAWSFELIVPENGIVFESDSLLLEISFDVLMFLNSQNVLGKHEDQFGKDFPIRFDFLDTFDGGNLSIQCHPSLDYIQEQFGEVITQDETYYILDCKEDATVYLGFQEDIDPENFKSVLEESNNNGKEVEIEKYVQIHKAKKHDLFLIPNGTIHSAGAQNLVLEISATPYIFTFKMYDWQRLDLNGKPRPINIGHAFKNLDFSRKGLKVQQELISKPYILSDIDDVICYHLPTHREHFYDVHRLEFNSTAEVQTSGICHVLILVEGSSVTVTTADGTSMVFAFAETFVIPAAAGSYKIVNNTTQQVKVIKAFLK